MQQTYGYPQPVLTPTPEQTEKRGLRRSGNVIGFMIIAMMQMQVAISVIQLALTNIGLLNPSAENAGLGSHEAYMAYSMVLYVLFLAVPTLIVALIARCRVNPFPLRRVKGNVLVLGVTGGMALAILANFITGWIMNILNNFGIPSPEFTETIQPTFISLVLHLISTAVLPAIIEEFIFRGYVLGSLRAHGDGVAIVVSAALFGLFHGNLTQIPFAFILGLVMGYLMVATNSILPAVLVHFANNAMSVLLSYWHQFCPGYENAITIAVFAVVTAIGVAALLAVRSRPDFFEPIGNGKSTLSAGTRARCVLTAPAMIVGLCLIGLEIISSVVVSFL